MHSVSPGSPVLSAADIEHFVTYGFIKLENCFDCGPGSLAGRWVEESWARNGLSPKDPDSWPEKNLHMPQAESAFVCDFSPKAFAAISELCGGDDRTDAGRKWGNGFIVNFAAGRDQQWLPPGPDVKGWHKDGDWFVHFLDSPEQALLIVALFSDIQPQGGGTFIACDSVGIVSRYLAAHPEGVNPFDLPSREWIKECRDFRETSGKAGDVFLLHPFMLHTASYNHRRQARFMINPAAGFLQPMCFDRSSDGSAYSPVELAILRGLDVDHLDFAITTSRRGVIPPRVAMQEELRKKELERLAVAGKG